MKKKIFSVLLILTLVLSFGLAVPASADTINVPGDYTTIQEAIDAASPGDVISVSAGTYVGDLVIAADKIGLELAGSDATIKGVANVPATSWPLAAPNIEILADGVSIHGFTVEGPDYVAEYYASGIVLNGINIEIYDNDFVDTPAETTDELSHSITTYSLTAIEGADCSGLNIHNNTFTGSGAVGSEFIYVNPHIGAGSITIDNNQFGGSVCIGATVESGGTSFTNNVMANDGGAGMYGVRFMDSQYGANGDYEDIVVTGNDISGFTRAVRVGNGSVPDSAVFAATVSTNTLTGNTLDVWCRNGSQLVVVADNSLATIENGNNDAGITTIDATYNWWGQSTGPIGGNVVGDVDTALWLLSEGGVHYDLTMPLPAGWSIISPDLELSGWEVADSVGLVYAYDEGAFVQASALDPVTPVFIKTADGGGIGFNYAAESMGIFSTDLEAGWNLIGIPLTNASPDAILSSIRLGANNEVALATLASQGAYNPSGDSFYESMLDIEYAPEELFPFDGYWAYMNVAKEFGVIVVE